MKLHVLSDLHIDFWKDKNLLDLTQTEADVTVLAGDIHTKARGIEWIKSHLPSNRKVIYIMGNHEYYKGNYPRTLYKIKTQASKTQNIFVLENDFIEIDDVVFLGTTLWTDLNLFGDYSLTARLIMNELRDFKKIRYGNNFRKFYPSDFSQLFYQAKQFLENKLNEFKDKEVIVVTHHAPSIKSVDQNFLQGKHRFATPAYASNLEDFICKNSHIKIWIHGHTHTFTDYVICNTRVISNPFGYYDDELVENFVPDLTIEI